MKLKLLGRTGLKVSELCLGTMTFGRDASEREAADIMDHFVSAGGNFFDTADVYSGGQSEEILGRWLSNHTREDYVVATKVRFGTSDNPNAAGLTRKHIMHSVQGSLKRLQTDYIDLLQVHAWDPLTPIDETLSALQFLVDSGMVLHLGASNFRGWQLAMSIERTRASGYSEFVSLQPQYNLLTRATEFELLPFCQHEQIAVLPWSPLKGGILSGKYDIDAGVPDNTRVKRHVENGMEPAWKGHEDYYRNVLSVLSRISTERGKTMAQVALNWLLCRKEVTSPIIGARNMQQLLEDMGATGWYLTEIDVSMLDDASALFVSYPYDAQAERQQQAGRL